MQKVVFPSIEQKDQKTKHLPTEATPSVNFISFEFGQPLPVRDVQILPQHISRMRCSLTPFIKVMLQHGSVKSVLFQCGSTRIIEIDNGARDVLPSTNLNQKVFKG